MTGFIINLIAALINVIIWSTTGSEVAMFCAIFSASVAVGFLVSEVAR